MESVPVNLLIGDEVYIQYEKGIYLGQENEQYKVEIINFKKEKSIKFIDYRPRKLDFQPPRWIKYIPRNELYRFSGETVAWMKDELRFYFKYNVRSTFNNEEFVSELDINNKRSYEKLEESETGIWNFDKITEELGKIYEEGSELREKIEELSKNIRKLEGELAKIDSKKDEIYKHCFHKWSKGDEEETGKNFLGTGKKRKCTCSNCGKEEWSYYTTLRTLLYPKG